MQPDRERLDQHGRFERNRIGNRKAIFRRQHAKFRRRAGRFAGTAHELKVPAGVFAARQALIAPAAANRRIDRHAVAGLERSPLSLWERGGGEGCGSRTSTTVPAHSCPSEAGYSMI